MKQKIIPIVSICIGLLAGILTHQYLKAKRNELLAMKNEILAGARKVTVMVTTRDLPSGSILRQSDLTILECFEMAVGDRAVRHADGPMLLGKSTLLALTKGKPIFWTDIEGGRIGASLAPMVKRELRALSIAVSGANAVSGMVEPNDKVDVLGTFAFPSKQDEKEMESVTLTVLQDVTVLATGQDLARGSFGESDNRRARSYSTVTLEVTPREAELLVFAQQMKGSLTLTLRNPEDVSFEKNLPEINFQQLETMLPELNMNRQRTIRHKNL